MSWSRYTVLDTTRLYISIDDSMLDAHVRRSILCKWIIMVRRSMMVMDGRNVLRLMFSRNTNFRATEDWHIIHTLARRWVFWIFVVIIFFFLLFCKLNAKMRAMETGMLLVYFFSEVCALSDEPVCCCMLYTSMATFTVDWFRDWAHYIMK